MRYEVSDAIDLTKRGWDASTRMHYLSRGFSVFNTSVYAVFLYHLSHSIGNRGGAEEHIQFADKIYYLNKIMNSVEWYWNIRLPVHFIVEHPLGSVLGKGIYGDYFSIYQGVTVGERLSRDVVDWPRLGHHVTMFAHSSVIGKCDVGDWVIISADTKVVNEDIPDHSIVFGRSPELVIKRCDSGEIRDYFVRSWRI